MLLLIKESNLRDIYKLDGAPPQSRTGFSKLEVSIVHPLRGAQ